MENEQSSTEPESEPAASSQSQPAPQKRLVKRKDAGWLSGVSAGIGSYTNIDPIWVRLAFVVGVFFGGAGLAIYVLALFFMPDATVDEMRARPIAVPPAGTKWTSKQWYTAGSGKKWAVILVIAMAISLAGALHIDGPSIWLAILFAGAGIFLLSDADRASDIRTRLFGASSAGVANAPGAHAADPATAGATTAGATATGATASGATATGATTSTYALPSDFRPTAAPIDPEVQRLNAERAERKRVERNERKILEFATVGVALVTSGILALLDRGDVFAISTPAILAVALLILGSGIVVGAFRGRSFFLIGLAILMTPIVIGANFADFSFNDGVGEKVSAPVAVLQLERTYRWGTGREVVDLRNVPLAANETRAVDVYLTNGKLEIRLPEGVGYDVAARADRGEVNVFDVRNDGFGSKRSVHQMKSGVGTYVINAEVKRGLVEVWQESQVIVLPEMMEPTVAPAPTIAPEPTIPSEEVN